MSWKEMTIMSERLAFVTLASVEGANMRELCRQYGISAPTGYKWLRRYQAGGAAALGNQSRRPAHSPRRTSAELEQLVCEVRQAHPAWGGRKINAYLVRQGYDGVPAASTVTEILRRWAQIDPQEALKHKPWQRFERAAPNELWQMDFKGHFTLADGSVCHPLTVLDDHSRFLIGLRACANESRETVQTQLIGLFRTYGLPDSMLMDNGSPWGTLENTYHLTALKVWLLRLDVRVHHGRPYHPQTQGKGERLHRTLVEEVLENQLLSDWATCQPHFDDWRHMYNYQRPHEALGMRVPADCYAPSQRPFPERLPTIQYEPDDLIRKVVYPGKIYVAGQPFIVSRALTGQHLACRPTAHDGDYDVYFCHTKICQISLRENQHANRSGGG
jgi:transposase InsO family protein